MLNIFKNIFGNSSQSISTSQLEELLKKERITLLDVRTPQEYRGGHIMEARSFPLDTIGTYKGKKDEPLYLICQSGMRSKRAAGILNKNGYQTVNIRGGMSAWSGRKVGGK